MRYHTHGRWSMIHRPPLASAVHVGLLAALAWVSPLSGCPPEILEVPDDDDTADDDTADDDTADDDDDTTPEGDQDGDGYTAAEGDCDDTNDAIHPGAEDVCDAWDNDCDGRTNEDSIGYDSYEPNDDDGFDLGELTESQQTINSFLHREGDQDRFLFYVYDGYLDWFYIDISAEQVPAAVDIRLELSLLDDVDHNYVGVLDTMDAAGPGGQESMSYGGGAGHDDTGTYELLVEADSGYDCDGPYTIQIVSGV